MVKLLSSIDYGTKKVKTNTNPTQKELSSQQKNKGIKAKININV